ncbi:hypothetical protein [Streptomyces lydicus]|uniref:hypothetical protein n=1 Tax=Streptomyces lydicus TaxID=47763 RepID=UPI00098258DE|nr:hypothetical protein [Streptomyces lydicus]
MAQTEERAEGAGPFTTRLTHRLTADVTSVWESRTARKRGALTIRRDATETTRHADAQGLRRLRIMNTVVATAFTIGGALFVLGAAVSQFGSGNPLESATIYFVGGLFFNTGAYASLLQTVNAPRRGGDAGTLETRRWRWWSYEPLQIDWLTTFVLFVGTLEFGINLLDSFLQGLTVQQTNRLIWAPDVIGCLLFLVSGHLALVEVSHGPLRLRPRELGWWIAAVSQLGSALFMVSAIADFANPRTGTQVNVAVTNWGTLTGAACFVAGGVLQYFEHPGPSDGP